MVDAGQTFPAGKLPGDLLARLLPGLTQSDPRVLIGPRVGTDAAAIDMGSSVLVVKSDPITFATDDAGWYLVNVNANDIACMGAIPKWLLVTALLPERSTTEALVTNLFTSLSEASDALGITLIGGHTEITIGLDRPILIGSMLGETARDRLVNPENVEPGDALLLCKGIAIEGTALLAREAPSQHLENIPADIIAKANGFLRDPGISVVQAATELWRSGTPIRAMHDPTEGGLATALREISHSARCGLSVDLDMVHIYPETVELCRHLEIDPLGLIASGALLATIPAECAESTVAHMLQAGIPCNVIGTFTEGPEGVNATRNGSPASLPEFAVDEIARYFAST